MTYTITNTAGQVVATIPTQAINTTATPLTLIGSGVYPYGGATAKDLVALCENFANTTTPPNPMPGMIWYNSTVRNENYFNGTKWVALTGMNSTYSHMFPMLNSATNINFAATGTTPIFTAPGNSNIYYQTAILLVPNGIPTATGPSSFNLKITQSEDVLDNVIINNPAAGKHAFFPIQGSARYAVGTETISLEVTSAVPTGTLRYDVYLFGLIRV